ncbi:MAG: glycoside hydrolase family 32 protein [Spirochaetota bacterium]
MNDESNDIGSTRPRGYPPNPPSLVPRFEFADDPAQQERQLADNPLLRRFAESRARYADDRYRPAFHFVSPESTLNDPNGLCRWKGRWHLFYQAYPPEDPRQHWGHAVSDDLVHWRDLPYAIHPGPEDRCFSGSTLVEDDRVIAIYHGTKAGTMVAVSSDPLLLNWEKLGDGPVIPMAGPDDRELPYAVFDPCIWKEGEVYYALTGGSLPTGPAGKERANGFLHRSTDLINWRYVHPFVVNDAISLVGDDLACPYFWPLGDHHVLLHFSHMSGGRYLLGDYDREAHSFVVTDGGRFNFGPVGPGGVHAPSAAPAEHGSVVGIFNMNPAVPGAPNGWDQVMTLARRFTLADGPHRDQLRIAPAGDLASLRRGHREIADRELPANEDVVLGEVGGTALELQARIDPGDAAAVELQVLRSAGAEELTRIICVPRGGYRRHDYGRHDHPSVRFPSAVSLDTTRSSTRPDVLCRLAENADVLLEDDEPFDLRVFVDRSIVEVFVNGKQALAARVYPDREDSTGVALRSRGRTARLVRLDAWEMRSVYPR